MNDTGIKEFSGEFKTKKPEIDFEALFYENKSFIYSGMFYGFGLFLGATFYKIAQSKLLDAIVKPEKHTLTLAILSNISTYMCVYVIVMFMGFCLVGYRLLNIIPAVTGFVAGINIAYFLINFQAKGLGYATIMIIPYSSLFITVISYTIKNSFSISKDIMDMTKGYSINYEPKRYMKTYLILGVVIIATAIIKALLTNLLFEIVTI